MSADGEVLTSTPMVARPVELTDAVRHAGPAPEVVLESSYGRYWAANVLAEIAARVHLDRLAVDHQPAKRGPGSPRPR
jgi:hypothetical protein